MEGEGCVAEKRLGGSEGEVREGVREWGDGLSEKRAEGGGKRGVKARSLATLGASKGRRPEDGEVISVERTLSANFGLVGGFAA